MLRRRWRRLLPSASERLELAAADLDERKLRRDEEAVQENEQRNDGELRRRSRRGESHSARCCPRPSGHEVAKTKNEMLIKRMRALAPETRPSLRRYQLDFVTPGINPAEASSRKTRREILKRRMNARRRPLTSQRLTTREGLASRGSCERPA